MSARERNGAEPGGEIAGAEALVGQLDEALALRHVAVSRKDEIDLGFVSGLSRRAHLLGEALTGGIEGATGRRRSVPRDVREEPLRIAVEVGEQRDAAGRHGLQDLEVTCRVVVGVVKIRTSTPEALVVADDDREALAPCTAFLAGRIRLVGARWDVAGRVGGRLSKPSRTTAPQARPKARTESHHHGDAWVRW